MCSHRHAALHLTAKFRSNRTIVGGVVTSYSFFKMAAGSHTVFDMGNEHVYSHKAAQKKEKNSTKNSNMLDHPRSATAGLSFVLKCGIDPIHSFGNIAILHFAVLAGSCLFTPILGSFGSIFPPNMVTHRFNPQNEHPCVETRRMSHKA